MARSYRNAEKLPYYCHKCQAEFKTVEEALNHFCKTEVKEDE